MHPLEALETLLIYLSKVPLLNLYLGSNHLFFRSINSSLPTRSSMVFFSAFISIISLSSISAIFPPSCASGTMWPTTKPWVPPEKRPSVIRATSLPIQLP